MTAGRHDDRSPLTLAWQRRRDRAFSASPARRAEEERLAMLRDVIAGVVGEERADALMAAAEDVPYDGEGALGEPPELQEELSLAVRRLTVLLEDAAQEPAAVILFRGRAWRGRRVLARVDRALQRLAVTLDAARRADGAWLESARGPRADGRRLGVQVRKAREREQDGER
ncbi:MAG: hypothetical protein F4X36_06150 [Gammaproteobacteria bacterium]|nr:hypothetical protein [Gammaproteobacteria bacterium]